MRTDLWRLGWDFFHAVSPAIILLAGGTMGWYMVVGPWWMVALMGTMLGVYLLYHYVVPLDPRDDFRLPPIGTRTVLYGYHTAWLHPFFVAGAWWRLYGFPWDPRLWAAFFVHDLGYWGLPNLDGPEGERHPEWGAEVIGNWFDMPWFVPGLWRRHPLHYFISWACDRLWGDIKGKRYNALTWYMFVRYHSRFLAQRDGKRYSALCVADKLAILMYPRWLFFALVRASGEIREYMETSMLRGEHPEQQDEGVWYRKMTQYVERWVREHRGLGEDRMTPVEREVRCERCGAVDAILSNWSPVQPCSAGCGGLMKVVRPEEEGK